MNKIEKTDAEWRAELAPDRYAVLREGATERAFTARIQVPAPVINGSPLTSFTGSWLSNEDLIIAAIAVPA